MPITELLLAELDREAWQLIKLLGTAGMTPADRSKISIDSTVLDELQEFLIKPKSVTPYFLR